MLSVNACEKFLSFPINIKAVSPDWLDHYQDAPFLVVPGDLLIIPNSVFCIVNQYINDELVLPRPRAYL